MISDKSITPGEVTQLTCHVPYYAVLVVLYKGGDSAVRSHFCSSGNQMVSALTAPPATGIAALQHTGEHTSWTFHSVTGLYVFNSHTPQYIIVPTSFEQYYSLADSSHRY